MFVSVPMCKHTLPLLCLSGCCPHTVVPSAATIVIVVCVSFLVFMIILGVFRIRAAHQRTMRDQENGKENEMDWDDSALTITVNPMEVQLTRQPTAGLSVLEDVDIVALTM